VEWAKAFLKERSTSTARPTRKLKPGWAICCTKSWQVLWGTSRYREPAKRTDLTGTQKRKYFSFSFVSPSCSLIGTLLVYF